MIPLIGLLVASWTPPTLMDLFLLQADPRKATLVLGLIMAAALLIYGAFWVWLKLRKKGE